MPWVTQEARSLSWLAERSGRVSKLLACPGHAGASSLLGAQEGSLWLPSPLLRRQVVLFSREESNKLLGACGVTGSNRCPWAGRIPLDPQASSFQSTAPRLCSCVFGFL